MQKTVVVPSKTNKRKIETMGQRKDIFVILGLVFIVNLSYSQENLLHLSDNLHVYKIEIPRKDHSLIETYVTIRKEDEALCPKPVILLLQGSGANSVFAYKEDKIYKPFLFKELLKHNKEWHIVCVEKRGVQLGDHVNASGFKNCSQEFIKYYIKENRVSDINTVINYLHDHNISNKEELIIIGHSEGAMIAPSVAAINSKVTHIALFGFSATHGLLDFLISQRIQLESNKIDEKEFHENYDWLVSTFKDVYHNREPERELFGHTYKRWLSFSFEKSLDDLLRVEAPIFLGIGSSDRSAPPLGSDIVIEEFIKAGKDNLTYKNYLGFDHDFMKKDKDKTYYGHSEVLVDILEWVRKTKKTRNRHRIKAGDRTPKTVTVPNAPNNPR